MISFGRPNFSRLAAMLMTSTSLLACSTGAQLEPADRSGQAVIYAKETVASSVTELDGKRVFSLSGKPLNVSAGPHRIEVTTCPEGSTVGCASRIYKLDLEAGRAYIVRSRTLVDVFNKTDMAAGRIDSLQWNGRAFINDKQFAAEREQMNAESERKRVAKVAERTRNQPRIRKIGARVCQRTDQSSSRVGFVEGMTDEKIQIRFSEEAGASNPGRIIWDRPINWDLCE